MKAVAFDKTTVEVGGDYLFRAEGEVLVFDGYLRVYGRALENGEAEGEGDDTMIQDGQIPAGLKKASRSIRKQDPQQILQTTTPIYGKHPVGWTGRALAPAPTLRSLQRSSNANTWRKRKINCHGSG
jgi:hypothetical protein